MSVTFLNEARGRHSLLSLITGAYIIDCINVISMLNLRV